MKKPTICETCRANPAARNRPATRVVNGKHVCGIHDPEVIARRKASVAKYKAELPPRVSFNRDERREVEELLRAVLAAQVGVLEQISSIEARLTAMDVRITQHLNELDNGPAVADAPLMTVEQVAAYLGLERASVYRLMREGLLPYSIVGSRRRIKRSDLDAYLAMRL